MDLKTMKSIGKAATKAAFDIVVFVLGAVSPPFD